MAQTVLTYQDNLPDADKSRLDYGTIIYSSANQNPPLLLLHLLAFYAMLAFLHSIYIQRESIIISTCIQFKSSFIKLASTIAFTHHKQVTEILDCSLYRPPRTNSHLNTGLQLTQLSKEIQNNIIKNASDDISIANSYFKILFMKL